jgi:hypothetical protein
MTGFEAVGVFENASNPPFERCVTRFTIPAQTGFWKRKDEVPGEWLPTRRSRRRFYQGVIQAGGCRGAVRTDDAHEQCRKAARGVIYLLNCPERQLSDSPQWRDLGIRSEENPHES